MIESPNKERIERLKGIIEKEWEDCYSPRLKGRMMTHERADRFLRYHNTFKTLERIEDRIEAQRKRKELHYKRRDLFNAMVRKGDTSEQAD